MIDVGTAGWSIPGAAADDFPGDGTHLERYARVLRCAEINSSFYRSHKFQVYEKWANQTSPSFRFSVKLPRAITHNSELLRTRIPLTRFLSEVAGLGGKLGALLVQLPTSLEFRGRSVRTFFQLLREGFAGAVVCEPRNASWFQLNAQTLLEKLQIGRVAADPSNIPGGDCPGGWMGSEMTGANAVVYYRLHGWPRKYFSRYPIERVQQWAETLSRLPPSTQAWCIFDNTAAGGAIENALELETSLSIRTR
ncbi:MAG: DUF72 domain-containing protein [Betaproteobacteria bacterium]